MDLTNSIVFRSLFIRHCGSIYFASYCFFMDVHHIHRKKIYIIVNSLQPISVSFIINCLNTINLLCCFSEVSNQL